MKLKNILFSMSLVSLVTLTSCSWDSVTRQQAIQLLQDIASSRNDEDGFQIPLDNPISVTFKHDYYENGVSKKKQIERYYYITSLYTNKPLIYKRYRIGQGSVCFDYREEYHYVRNNEYFSKVRQDETKNTWICSQGENSFPSVHSIIWNEINDFIKTYDKPDDFAKTLIELDAAQPSEDYTVKDSYRSTSLGSLTGEIYEYRNLLDGKSEPYTKMMFNYNDNLFHSLSYENYLDPDKTSLKISIDYFSYASFDVDSLVCEEPPVEDSEEGVEDDLNKENDTK